MIAITGITNGNISNYSVGVSRQVVNSVIGWVASVGSPFDTAFSRLGNGIVTRKRNSRRYFRNFRS